MVCGVDFWEVVDELPIAEEEGFPARFVVGVDDLEGIANFPIDIRKEGEGETEFVREGLLVCHGVHGDSDDLNLFFGESGRCSLQRFDLFGSPEGIRDRIEADGGPGPAEGVFEIDQLSGLGGGSEFGSHPACGAGFDFYAGGAA